MSIREINDQYKEYADAHEPVKGKKSHGGIAIRMQQAAKAAALSVTAMTVLTTVVLNIVFTLSAQVLPQIATFHEVEFSYVVETSDFAEAGVYYTLTAPDGTVIASAPLTQENGTMQFSDLEENTQYTFSLFDKNGKQLDSAALTTADNPAPVPSILSLTASYNRLTETVTIHGQVDVDDAPNFTAVLSSSDFPLDAAAVEVTVSENGTADVSYSGLHPLTMDTYNVELTVGYTDEEDAQKQLTKTTSFHVGDLVIKGFSGTVNDEKIINLDAIATHHHTDSEPYTIRSVTITGKQIYTGKNFDVPATFTVNGDTIAVKAATDALVSGKYRFTLEIGYTINGTDTPILTATTDAIEVMVPYLIPEVTPTPVITPAPTPVITPVPTPVPTPAYTDLEINEAATSAGWDMNFYAYSAVTINDAENITGTASIADLGLQANLTLTDNGDGTIDATADLLGNTVAPGQYELVFRYDYTLNGAPRSKITSRTVWVGGVFIDNVYRNGDSTSNTINTDVTYTYLGTDGVYSIDAVRVELYDSAQNLITTVARTTPAFDPSHVYYNDAYFTDLTDTVYYVKWIIDYTVGEGSHAYSANTYCSLVRVDMFDPALATQAPTASYTVSKTASGAAMTFHISGNAAQEVSAPVVLINSADAAAAGYTVTNNISNADGTVTVSGPFSGLTEVSLMYDYILVNSDLLQSGYASGYLDVGYFTGLTLSGITVTPNGDGTATVSGSISTANTAPVVLTNVAAHAVGADSTEYGQNSDTAPAFDSSTNSGTFTITAIPIPTDGEYTVHVQATGYSNHPYPYNITVTGEISVAP